MHHTYNAWSKPGRVTTVWSICCAVVACALAFSGTALAQTDGCGYPDNSNPPRSQVIFNESQVLRAFSPLTGGFTFLGDGLKIRMWYNDEHALTLGVRQVIVKNAAGAVVSTTDYTIAKMHSSTAPDSAFNPAVGSTITLGQQAGVDAAFSGKPDSGRPMYPVLFVTDLGPNSNFNTSARGGDWQQGVYHNQTGFIPNAVYGSWKGAVRTFKTSVPPTAETKPDADPSKNNWAGVPDVPPVSGGFAGLKNEGYGAECVWNVDNLGLTEGRTYRFQFMDHDGDQNKTGGDVGEACTIVSILKRLACDISPADTTICLGGSATLTAIPHDGLPPFRFLWSTGETTKSILVTPTAEDSFSVTVSDKANEVSVCRATVHVDSLPTVTRQPSSAAVCVGSTTCLVSTAQGKPVPTIQWQVSTDNGATWNDVPGATKDTLCILFDATKNNFKYRACFTNKCGTACSDAATLTDAHCNITLDKSADKSDIAIGANNSVVYTYVITNKSAVFAWVGTLVDDNGTPGTGDDFNPCFPEIQITIPPSGSHTCRETLNVTATRRNIALACGDMDGITNVCAKDTVVVQGHVRGIEVTKTGTPSTVPAGIPTFVTFTYKVKNTGTFFNASGCVSDDNGTPAVTSDDFGCKTGELGFGPLPPGDSVTLSKTVLVTTDKDRTNIAVACDTTFKPPICDQDSFKLKVIPCNCTVKYPFTSSNNRTSIAFNESEVLRAFSPDAKTCAKPGESIKLWYNDEHALTLGIRQVKVLSSGGTLLSTTNYDIDTAAFPGVRNNPRVGSTIETGEQAGIDKALGADSGRPMYPSLFLTDITDDTSSLKGDWQFRGKATAPTKVYGVSKAAVRTYKRSSPASVTITPDADPAKNNWTGIPDTPPGGFASLKNEGFGAECVWSIDSLINRGLMVAGRAYRCYIMVHDGDQNKTGGDVGQGCTKAFVPLGTVIAVSMPQAGEEAASSVKRALPVEYMLHQNFPNPFNPTTMIGYDLPEASHVRLSVFNILGQEVTTLVDGIVEAGYHTAQWNSTNNEGQVLPSGVYIYRMTAKSLTSGGFHQVKKMLLVK